MLVAWAGPARHLGWSLTDERGDGAPLGPRPRRVVVDSCSYGSLHRRRLAVSAPLGNHLAGNHGCSLTAPPPWPRGNKGAPFLEGLPERFLEDLAEAADDWWDEERGPGTGRESPLTAEDIPGVPPSFVARNWNCTWRHPWTRREHLNELEGRALLKAAERACSSAKKVGKQHLICTDSQVMLGVAQKGRSSRPRLNRFARQLAALSLGYRQLFLFRWVSTKLNPADGPSRSFGPPAGSPESQTNSSGHGVSK